MSCHSKQPDVDPEPTRARYAHLHNEGLKIDEIALLMKISVETLQEYLDKWEEEDEAWRNREL